MLKKFWLSIIAFVLINNFLIIPSQATSADAITLESISAVSTTVLTGENIVMQLEVAVPTGFSWDPRADYLGYTTKVLFCKNSIYSEISGVGTCTYGSTQSSYAIGNISDITESISGSYKLIQFKISGLLFSGINNDYKLFRVIVAGAELPLQEEIHKYDQGKTFALEGVFNRTDILVPTFLNGDVSDVAPTPTPTPSPTVSVTPTPTPSPTVTESVSPTPTPSASETSPPVSRSVSSPPSLISVISSFINPIAIQASGQILKKAPNSNGDLTWQKSKEISVKSKVWKSKASSKASGGSYISTSKHKSKLSLITKGDAFTLDT